MGNKWSHVEFCLNSTEGPPGHQWKVWSLLGELRFYLWGEIYVKRKSKVTFSFQYWTSDINAELCSHEFAKICKHGNLIYLSLSWYSSTVSSVSLLPVCTYFIKGSWYKVGGVCLEITFKNEFVWVGHGKIFQKYFKHRTSCAQHQFSVTYQWD